MSPDPVRQAPLATACEADGSTQLVRPGELAVKGSTTKVAVAADAVGLAATTSRPATVVAAMSQIRARM
jgi:hypothetical protein